MKKIIIMLLISMLALGALAFPRGPRPPMRRMAPVHHVFRPHRHHHAWVAPVAFGVGALVGATVAQTVPVRVWVPPYYVTRYDVYGRPYQVLVPGHWEWR